jgi:hypothetical protein
LSLDFDSAETRFGMQPVEPTTPESVFNRQWALTLLSNVQAKLHREMMSDERGELYESLTPHLVGDPQQGSGSGRVPFQGLPDESGCPPGNAEGRIARRRLALLYLSKLLGEVSGQRPILTLQFHETLEMAMLFEIPDRLRRLFRLSIR